MKKKQKRMTVWAYLDGKKLVDCVLTHCAPTSVTKALDPSYQPDKLTDFLESVKERCRFSQWFCGHYHINQIIDERFVVQWEQISRIDVGSSTGE